MELGKRSSSMEEVREGLTLVREEEEFGFRVVVRTRSFGRKRIAMSPAVDSYPPTPLKRLCSGGSGLLDMEIPARAFSSNLESVPQDILVRILCGVEHDDLKRLINVSKTVKDATLVAKETHFEYSTPRKVPAFRTPVFPNEYSDQEIEAPDAPRQIRPHRSRLGAKGLDEVAVTLFASPMRRRVLFMDSEI